MDVTHRNRHQNTEEFYELSLNTETMGDSTLLDDDQDPLLGMDGCKDNPRPRSITLTSVESQNKEDNKRNLLAFWIFGLCNNFAYVIMLSAAHDILREERGEQNKTHTVNTTSNSTILVCNRIGTGAILLADILPAFLIKLSAPLYIQRLSYNLKITIIIVTTSISFILVATADTIWLSILGVCYASFSSGFGEVTFLSLTSFFHKNVVSTWSSGTGGAGVFGALSYAGLTQIGITPRNAVLMMLIIPVIFAFSYFILLKKPPVLQSIGATLTQHTQFTSNPPRLILSPKEKLLRIVKLLKYMVPLFLVYVAEYYINQALFELLYFNGFWLTPFDQYRWLQVDYQIGVFIARSSVNLYHIKKLWIPAFLQFGVLALLQCQVLYHFLPSFWVVLGIVIFEGLQGGLAYVNTFYRLSSEIASEYLEFSMGVTSIADSSGTVIAGLLSIPAHNKLCDMHIHL